MALTQQIVQENLTWIRCRGASLWSVGWPLINFSTSWPLWTTPTTWSRTMQIAHGLRMEAKTEFAYFWESTCKHGRNDDQNSYNPWAKHKLVQ